ncbi:MAG: hypothetical protein Unbinned400contig1000_1 [Prokaryotic dsDNA virus sp.]|mgnify:CR=1 FL=1|nr:MAG: hypothetical protein Unbinned400contig1000_1 [Prokaryotic dsDNA virus sp.]
MFFWDKVEKYVDIDLIDGGIDIWASYGFVLCSWILFTTGVRVYVRMKRREG